MACRKKTKTDTTVEVGLEVAMVPLKVAMVGLKIAMVGLKIADPSCSMCLEVGVLAQLRGRPQTVPVPSEPREM